jgi:hypothetical protein
LGSAREVSQTPSGNPEALHSIDYVVGLRDKGVADGRAPDKIIVHPFENIWVMGQSFDAVVPRLNGDLVLGKAALRRAVGKDNLSRERGGGKKVGKQGIRVKRD